MSFCGRKHIASRVAVGHRQNRKWKANARKRVGRWDLHPGTFPSYWDYQASTLPPLQQAFLPLLSQEKQQPLLSQQELQLSLEQVGQDLRLSSGPGPPLLQRVPLQPLQQVLLQPSQQVL